MCKNNEHDLGVHEQNYKNEKKYECTQCEKKYKYGPHLKEHMNRAHFGVQYECTQCEKKYNYRHHLKVHVNSAHIGVKYNCEQCGKNWKHKSGLSQHIKQRAQRTT